MPLELFNTLSGNVESLYAADGATLRFYCCGPTTYDYGHIGNFRTFLHVDVLRRAARLFGLGLHHVMNITDVDDKIIDKAMHAGQTIGQYSARFEKAFFEDMAALQIERPETIAHATGNIAEMAALIQRLAAAGAAYQTEDGSWYFRIASFPAYGQLSKKDLEGIEDGARIDVADHAKESVRDFALWKASKPGEPSWDTPIGPGRPGWHLECSAMALKYLGDSFDLHAGGEDLMFPHHENEIAQSEAPWINTPEAGTHRPFARHWFHVRFLLVEGKKMSKSEGNFFTLRDLLLKGYRASAIRFLLLSVPYRQQLNFTFEALAGETAAIDRLRTFQQRLLNGHWPATLPETTTNLSSRPESAHSPDLPSRPESAPTTDLSSRPESAHFADAAERPAAQPATTALSTLITAADTAFTAALANDLNTAEARAAIFDLLRAVNTAADHQTLTQPDADATLAVLAKFDSVFAVLQDNDADLTRAALAWAEAEGRLAEASPEVLASFGANALTDAEIDALIAERTLAKKQRNFARADAIRNDLLAKGIVLEDSKDGVRWKRS